MTTVAMIVGLVVGMATTKEAKTTDLPRNVAETMDGVVMIGIREAVMGAQATAMTTSLTTSATAIMYSD